MPLTSPKDVCSKYGPGELGVGYTSFSSRPLVFNSNTKVVQTPNNDPWGIISGLVTNHGVVRAIPTNRDYAYLHLCHAWSDVEAGSTASTETTVQTTTDPIVRVYGRIPASPEPHKPHVLPQEDDTSFPDLLAAGVWRPLLQDGASTSLVTLDSDETEAARLSFGENDVYVGLPETWYIAGCDLIVVTVSTAVVFTPSDAHGMVIGHFSG